MSTDDIHHTHALYLDLEWTCWNAPPPPGMQQEIIEIGIVEMDLVMIARRGESNVDAQDATGEVIYAGSEVRPANSIGRLIVYDNDI